MELNDIKKILYKTKPSAYFMYAREGCLYYHTLHPMEFFFRIQVSDIGEATYMPEMAAQLMIRYLITTMPGTEWARWSPTVAKDQRALDGE